MSALAPVDRRAGSIAEKQDESTRLGVAGRVEWSADRMRVWKIAWLEQEVTVVARCLARCSASVSRQGRQPQRRPRRRLSDLVPAPEGSGRPYLSYRNRVWQYRCASAATLPRTAEFIPAPINAEVRHDLGDVCDSLLPRVGPPQTVPVFFVFASPAGSVVLSRNSIMRLSSAACPRASLADHVTRPLMHLPTAGGQVSRIARPPRQSPVLESASHQHPGGTP